MNVLLKNSIQFTIYDFKKTQCKVFKLTKTITKMQLIAMLNAKQTLKFCHLAVIE